MRQGTLVDEALQLLPLPVLDGQTEKHSEARKLCLKYQLNAKTLSGSELMIVVTTSTDCRVPQDRARHLNLSEQHTHTPSVS